MVAKRTVTALLVVLTCAWCCAQSGKKIVFVAGPKDHGGAGMHEYEKDLRLLQKCLETSPNVKGITTAFYGGRLPKDIAAISDAATIVIHSSGDQLPKETHALFPQAKPTPYTKEEREYLAKLDALMKNGTGLVVLHYSLIIRDPGARAYFMDWIGGYHGNQSKVKLDRSEARPATPKHPILTNIRPWTTDHEYYFDQYFGEKKDPRFVPILTSKLPTTDPKQHVVAWAVERKGGGRGFAFTGGHYHKNMLLDDYRRMLLNAICWTAKIPVPAGGVASTVPSSP